MKNKEIFLPEDIYETFLKTISDIQFTQREIDIISFYVCGRSSKKIASSLLISPKTVEYHTRNILLKLGCNSREGIVDFVEQSKKLSLVRKYHAGKLIDAAFKNTLKSLSTQNSHNQFFCDIVYWPKQTLDTRFVHFLKEALKYFGVVTSLKTREDYPSLSQLIEEKRSANQVIYILSPTNEDYHLKEVAPHENLNGVLFLFPAKGFSLKDSQKENLSHFLNLTVNLNPYFYLFEILKKLFPHLDVEKEILSFQEQYELIQGENISKDTLNVTDDRKESQENKFFFNTKGIYLQRKWRYLSGGGFIGLGAIIFLMLQGVEKNDHIRRQNQVETQQNKKELNVRSDIVIPSNTKTLLDRSALITQLDKKFSKQNGIKTVALIGVGGAGKTTLAHQYANLQKASIIWEINADSTSSLKESFENFAYRLAQAEEDKKTLSNIQEMKDSTNREKKIIQFVKDRLKLNENWFLIYDNVEKFKNIYKYFPHDSQTWGQGKIILTTRDSHIQNNVHIKDTLFIDELNQDQKLNLFLSIIENGMNKSLTPIQKEEIKNFLIEIPPFPLDISVAAYYLKGTSVSYQEYIGKLKHYDRDFENIQKNLLEESGSNYNKTRNSIIMLSLKNILNVNKDFEGLLLLLSLLDSQNIPIELLKAYKNDAVVESFIYHLKAYSLLLDDFSTFSPGITTISIHRSTQQIILSSLISELNLRKNIYPLENASKFLEAYTKKILEIEDITKMKLLINHCEKYIAHDLLPEEIKNSISTELGHMYLYLSSHQKAKEIFEITLEKLNKNNKKDYDKIAYILIGLEKIYTELGDHEKAKENAEQSLMIYRKYSPHNFRGIAKGIASLGSIYRGIGNYEKARELFEQCLQIYKQHLPKSYINIAQISARLGNVYRSLGEYEKAKDLFEETLAIYKNMDFKNYNEIVWASVHLGHIYCLLGDHENAKNLLEKAVITYTENLPANQFRYAWALAILGETQRSLGSFRKAQELLEESFKIHKELFPEDYMEIAWISVYLGNLYREIGYYKKATILLEKSFEIHKQHYNDNHLKMARLLGYLGNLYKDLGELEKAEALFDQSLKTYKKHLPQNHINIAITSAALGNVFLELNHHKKAKDLLENSYKIYEKYYGKDHIETIQVLMSLGQVYFDEGNRKDANEIFKNSIKILRESKHPSLLRSLESLSNLYFKELKRIETEKDMNRAQNLKNEIASLLKEVLALGQIYLPKDSDHLIRIQNKLDNLKN